MREKKPAEMELAKVLKAYRAAIRLKHALNADEEINETLPKIEESFHRALAAGKPYRLDVRSVFAR